MVIPVRDRPRELAACLQALDPAVAVTVVDDASKDGEAIAKVVARYDARLLRRARSAGPAAARNTALDSVETELVAFLDSDCVPSSDWLSALVGHFEDPVVGAVAPRVRPLAKQHGGAVVRYLQGRCPLDMGAAAAPVWPGGRVGYLPSAALLVRRTALGDGFDESLRYGEDVDLVWRLDDAGWRVRYDPSVTVWHDELSTGRAMLARRFRYGGSAAPLSARHGRRLAPALLHRGALACTGLALFGRGRSAGALVLLDWLLFMRTMSYRGVPTADAACWYAEAALQTTLALARPSATLGIPVIVGIVGRRRIDTMLGLLMLPAFLQADRRRTLELLRWTMLATLDDIAYAAGVWHGALKHRTLLVLLPMLANTSLHGSVPQNVHLRPSLG